jgi:hypothetical protein
MRGAVYNLGIPNVISKFVTRVSRSARGLRFAAQLSTVMLGLVVTACAVDWSVPEQQLSRKIVAVTGSGAVSLTVVNRSSLGRRDYEAIRYGLSSSLGSVGIHSVKQPEQAATTIIVSLSENPTSYVWVAEIHKTTAEATVVLVSAPRPDGATGIHESVPLTLRKISLWTADDPILDVAVLAESAMPTQVAVLDPDRVSLYRWQGARWQLEQTSNILHTRPWPRDLRGRLVAAKDHLLDVYLPGVICRSSGSSLSLNCRESDDPWPLMAAPLVSGANGGALSVFPSASMANGASTLLPELGAFFASTRNFFTGALTPGVGTFTTVPKFYSAAVLPHDKYALWLFTATDGQVHIVDGVRDEIAKLGWGSDLASVKTSCGAGWQVLATNAGEASGDSVRAYEFPDRDPVAVSAPVDFAGSITAMWAEARGDTAVVITRNRETGSYEAFRLALACGQ